MKKDKLFKSNTFVINLSVCVLILLIMCYFGINTSVKRTYSASGTAAATCGSGKIVVDAFTYVGSQLPLKKELTSQYCCPTGSTWHPSGYCVKNGYDVKDIDGVTGLQCTQTVTDGAATWSSKNVCSNNLGDGWLTNTSTCEYKTDFWNATCECYRDKSFCTSTAVDPTYPEGACFFVDGDGYYWSTTVEQYYTMNEDSRAVTTEAACKNLDTQYKASLFQCFKKNTDDSDQTNDRYMWSDDEDFLIGDGWGYATDLTTKKECIRRNQYTVNYSSTATATKVPSTGIKFGGVNLNVSSQIPLRYGSRFLGWTTSSTSKTVYYNPGDVLTSDNNYNLYALWNVLGIASVKDYNYEVGRDIILGVPEVTLVNTFKSKFTVNDGFLLTASDTKQVSGSDVLYTGAKITVTTNGFVPGGNDVYKDSEEFTIVVKGDIDGDGKLSAKDYMKLYRHLSRNYSDNLQNESLLAADYDLSETQDVKDYMAMYTYLKDKYDPN